MSTSELIISTTEPTVEEIETGETESRRGLLWRRFRRSRMGMLGTVVFVLLTILAIVGPRWIAQWGYTEVDRGTYLQSPSSEHWLGTTQDGRDLFALSMRGLGKSMIIGLSVAILSTTLSAVVGSFAAYFKGWTDRVSLWVIDLLLVLPSFIIIAVHGAQRQPGRRHLGTDRLLTLLSWMLTARVVRSLTMSVQDRDYVTAAKYMGVGGPRIVFRHILPNISSLLIIDVTIGRGGRRARRDDPVVLRLRHPASRDVARHADRRRRTHGDDVPVGLPRRRHPARAPGAVGQLHRRRPARRARPDVERERQGRVVARRCRCAPDLPPRRGAEAAAHRVGDGARASPICT